MGEEGGWWGDNDRDDNDVNIIFLSENDTDGCSHVECDLCICNEDKDENKDDHGNDAERMNGGKRGMVGG